MNDNHSRNGADLTPSFLISVTTLIVCRFVTFYLQTTHSHGTKMFSSVSPESVYTCPMTSSSPHRFGWEQLAEGFKPTSFPSPVPIPIKYLLKTEKYIKGDIPYI